MKSWIVWCVHVYVILIIINMFSNPESDFWAHYYWLTSKGICFAALMFNTVKFKTNIERAYISFLSIQSLFNIGYYIAMIKFRADIFGDNYDKHLWIANTYFLGTMFVAAFIAFKKMKPWKESL